MTRHETPFVIDRDLIIVEAVVIGPRGMATGKFVVDTGTSLTTMIPELADLIGYSARRVPVRARSGPVTGDSVGPACPGQPTGPGLGSAVCRVIQA